jgi:hypothetical protein
MTYAIRGIDLAEVTKPKKHPREVIYYLRKALPPPKQYSLSDPVANNRTKLE